MLPLRSFSLPRVLIGTFAGVLLGGLGLGGCSTPEQPVGGPGAAPGVSLLEAAPHSTGQRVDSLNGISGHQFGEPLSAFPGLRFCRLDTDGEPQYFYGDAAGEKIGGWWGKQNRKKLGSVEGFYSFPGGRFAGVVLVGNGLTQPKILPEAKYLFGPGDENETGVTWTGKKCEAYYAKPRADRSVTVALIIRSHDFTQQVKQSKADRERKAAAQLKAENTP